MPDPLPPWRKSDNFSTPAHQRILDNLNTLAVLAGSAAGVDVVRTPTGTTIVDTRAPRIVELIFGKVTNTGPNGDEADFADGRYWVTKQRPAFPTDPADATALENDDAPAGDEIAVDNPDTDPDAPPTIVVPETIVMATNVTPGDAHTLAVDTPVLMVGVAAEDDTGASEKRYLLIPTAAPESLGELDGEVHQMTSQNTDGWADLRLVNR